MTTNPDRLWCLKDREDGAGFVFAWDTEERASYGFAFGRRKPVQAYVREDIAAAAVTNAPGYETAMAEANRASRLEDEAAALRAEAEALRAKVDAAARTALSELRALLVKEAKHAKCIAEDERADGIGIAIDAIDKAALAAKGVG